MKRSMQVRLLSGQIALATVLMGSLWAHAGEPIGGINVSLEQIPGGISINFGNDDIPTIPADFFDPGSEPFTGTVEMRLGGREDTSDVFEIEHGAWITLDGLPPGEPVQGTLPEEKLHLEMSSKAPLEVLIGGSTYEFDVTVTVSYLDALGNPLPGQLHIESLGGNTYAVDSFFDIIYEIEFNPTAASPGSQRILSFEIPQRLALQQDTPWRHSEPGGTSTDGFFLGTDGTNIIPYTFATPAGGLVLNLHSVPVPEPASGALASLALAALALRARSRRR